MANEGLPEWFTPETAPEQLMPEQPEDLPSWFTASETVPEAAPPVPKNLGFTDRLKAMTDERLGNIEKSLVRYQKGDQGYGSTFIQGMGNGIAWLGDIVGESAATILSELTPDEAEKWLKEQIASGAKAILDTDTARALLKEYKNLDPVTRDNIAGTTNILMAAIAPKSMVGSAIKNSGIKADINGLGKMMLDQDTNAKKMRFGEIGKEPAQQFMAKRDRDIMNTVISIDGMAAGLPRKKMIALLNKENAAAGQQIRGALAGVKGRINKNSMRKVIERELDELGKLNPAFVSEDLLPARQKLLRQLQTTFDQFGDAQSFSAQELLNVRRKFDKAVETAFKKNMHEGDDAFRPMLAAVRDRMNQTMENLAPDSNIRALMRRQHHIMLAADNLSFYNAMQKSTPEKILRKVEGHPLLTASALGITGGGSALLSPALGIGAGVLGTGYMLSRPMARRGAGEALKSVPFGRSMFYGYDEEQQQ